MKKTVQLTTALLLSVSLAGCVGIAEPSPYYGGRAPYYGTAYVPAYAYGEVNVASSNYYPYQRSQHIYSNYNTNYWHHQQQAGHPQPQAHSAPQQRSVQSHTSGQAHGDDQHH